MATDREFGELSERVKNLSESVREFRSEVKAEVKSINENVDSIRSILDQAGGGMKVAMAVSGLVGAFAMVIITKVLPWLFAGLPRL